MLHGISVDIPARSRIAIVGETGSGKTTFAKLLTRMMDPASGELLIGGIPLHLIPYSSLRSRVIMVPQEGFLFDTSVAGNLLYGKPDATHDEMRRALDELGLGTWADELPDGLDTPVGQRGESLSAGGAAAGRPGSRLSRRPRRDRARRGHECRRSCGRRAPPAGHRRPRPRPHHRSPSPTGSPPQSAPTGIMVLDHGDLVEHGTHAELVELDGGIYAGLHRSWVAHRASR